MNKGLRYWAAQDAKKGGHEYVRRPSHRPVKDREMHSCGSRMQGTKDGHLVCSKDGARAKVGG